MGQPRLYVVHRSSKLSRGDVVVNRVYEGLRKKGPAARRLAAAGGDLSRRALEALAADEYRHDRITKSELQRLLGIETSYELDGFLKAHDIWIEYTTPSVSGAV